MQALAHRFDRPPFSSLFFPEFYDGLPSDAWQVIASDFNMELSRVPRESAATADRSNPVGETGAAFPSSRKEKGK